VRLKSYLVAKGGIEPPTQGFSVLGLLNPRDSRLFRNVRFSKALDQMLKLLRSVRFPFSV
jgi:hypothetical protein